MLEEMEARYEESQERLAAAERDRDAYKEQWEREHQRNLDLEPPEGLGV